jgi:hypothetical protein
MTVSRLRHIPGTGVDKVGDAADGAGDPRFLRLENLDTDLTPPLIARQVTHAAQRLRRVPRRGRAATPTWR